MQGEAHLRVGEALFEMNKLQQALNALQSAAVMMPRNSDVTSTAKAVKAAIRLEQDSNKPDHELQRDRLAKIRQEMSAEAAQAVEKYLSMPSKTKDIDEQILACLLAAKKIEEELGEDCALREGLCVWLPAQLRKRFLKGLNEPIPEPKAPEPVGMAPQGPTKRPTAMASKRTNATNSRADAMGLDGGDDVGVDVGVGRRRRETSSRETDFVDSQGLVGRRSNTPLGSNTASKANDIFGDMPSLANGMGNVAVFGSGGAMGGGGSGGGYGLGGADGFGSVGFGGSSAMGSGGGRGNGRCSSGQLGLDETRSVSEIKNVDEAKSALIGALVTANLIRPDDPKIAAMSIEEVAQLVQVAAPKLATSDGGADAQLLLMATKLAVGDNSMLERAAKRNSAVVDNNTAKRNMSALANKSVADGELMRQTKASLIDAMVTAGLIADHADPRVAAMSAEEISALLSTSQVSSRDATVVRALKLAASIANGDMEAAKELVTATAAAEAGKRSRLEIMGSGVQTGLSSNRLRARNSEGPDYGADWSELAPIGLSQCPHP